MRKSWTINVHRSVIRRNVNIMVHFQRKPISLHAALLAGRSFHYTDLKYLLLTDPLLRTLTILRMLTQWAMHNYLWSADDNFI